MTVDIQPLSLEQKWLTAEANLVYFIVCGITFAKQAGQTAADFGRWAGEVAAPTWEGERRKGPKGLVEGIAANKQQFHGFQMVILDDAPDCIRGKMKSYGEGLVQQRPNHEISAEEYIEFFGEKWEAIAHYLDLEYRQVVEGDWLVFTVSRK